MTKAFEGFFTRPQGGPMVFPYTSAAKISQFPWRYFYNECFYVRYSLAVFGLVVLPVFWKIDKALLSPENKALWREKRKSDRAAHWHHMEKNWEVRT